MLIASIHEDRSQIAFLNSHTVCIIWSIPFSWVTGSYIEAFDMQVLHVVLVRHAAVVMVTNSASVTHIDGNSSSSTQNLHAP